MAHARALRWAMPTGDHIRVLVNPKAGSGRARQAIPAIVRALTDAGARFDVVQTEAPGQAGSLVTRAREDGVNVVAIVGGDGTVNEAVQGYLDASGELLPGPDLALIPAGTGGDFRKSFDLPDSIPEAVQRMLSALPRPLDLGVAELTGDDGRRRTCAFVNVLSFGVGGLTDKIVNESGKWMGGRAAFFMGALRAMAVYRAAPVAVEIDGRAVFEGRMANVAVANGRYFGGGMKIAPDADPSDGRFEVVVIEDMGILKSLAFAPSLYAGTHVTRSDVSVFHGARVSAKVLRADEPVLIDLDGEAPGRLPLDVRVAPGALKIRA